MSTMPIKIDFSDALRMLKAHYRVTRAGWNGKNMWLALTQGGEYGAGDLATPAHKAHAIQNGGTATLLSYITMKTADNCIVPWLASQTDLLAEDWIVLD